MDRKAMLRLEWAENIKIETNSAKSTDAVQASIRSALDERYPVDNRTPLDTYSGLWTHIATYLKRRSNI